MQEQQREVIAPASMPQEIFINSDADITIGSGSAGSSKSYSILLRWLRFANVPNSRGIVFRKITKGKCMQKNHNNKKGINNNIICLSSLFFKLNQRQWSKR